MFVHPGFDPVAIALGPLKIHWYGLSYLAGFYLFWWISSRRARTHPHIAIQGWNKEVVSDLLFYGVMGVILGGRLGYVVFYSFDRFLADPLYLVQVWKGGMSFHGGLLGVMTAMLLFARKMQMRWWQVLDFVAVATPAGLLTGRIGNFINGELWGRPTDVPWGMVFPNVGSEPRHASQLYEAGLEGLVMLIILYGFARKPRPMMAVSGLFLILYGVFRTFVEFFRTPDEHIGFLAFDWLTMGMLLCIPMWASGLAIMAWAYKMNEFAPAAEVAAPARTNSPKRKKRS